ncbi:Transposase [Cordylochernes scorpioides]|uniref:Transposase n=1 Tax=Cordylochernes scorpioides TaxID=51811 RepID=A0ABY6JV26_9ARAC|nr:Transposase [Cordylochernes scorpioides]
MEMSTPANSTNLAILGLHPSAYKVRRTPVIKAKWDVDGARESERMWGQQTHGSWLCRLPPRLHGRVDIESRQDSGRQGTSKQIDHCLYRKMEQGREENPKEPMESDPDSESGGSTTFPKKENENTLGRTEEIAPGQEDVTPPPPVSDVLGRLTTTLPQLSAVTGHRERWNRYDGSYEAQSFFTNYDAQADRAQLQYSTRLRKPANLLQAPLRVTNTRATISRRLVANGLHSCRPLRRLPLTPPNRRLRLEWCRARSTWMTEWHRVVFSDESRFCLSGDSRRVRVWRRRGERSNPAAIVERPTVRQRGIMVWGAIAYDSRSPLLRIQGTMTAQRYVDDMLRPVTLPYLQGVPNALYQQDNARPHTARISQQALQDVQMLPWPPYSPDLSPIEHVWDIIERRLHALPQPRSEDELWQMVEREWRAIPQDAIRTLIDSLPRRVAACIAVRGGPTCY